MWRFEGLVELKWSPRQFRSCVLYIFRISLSVIVTPDDKELINNGKIYKKIGNKIVKDPEAETFPLWAAAPKFPRLSSSL